MSRGLADDRSQTVGRYQLLRRLGVGGMGEVFLARETGIAGVSRLVVVKRLLPEVAEQTELVELFKDEARIAAPLSHPNIVQIHEFGEIDGTYFLAMEYVPGQSVARLCECARKAGAPIPRAVATHIVAEAVRGLAFAHDAVDADGRHLGLVHRDVSPQNVLVSVHGDVKLVDFGIAKAANKVQRTRTGVVRGKFSYMAPEQLRGEDVNARADVFAAGVMLWELTLERRLFRGRNEPETIKLVESGPIPRPREIDPDYPADLEAIVMAALERSADARTASAGALHAALIGHLRRLPDAVGPEVVKELVRRLAPEETAATEAEVATDAATSARAATAAASPRAGRAPAATPSSAPTAATRPLVARRPRWPLVAGALGVAVVTAIAVVAIAGGGWRSEPAPVTPASPVAAVPAAALDAGVRPDAAAVVAAPAAPDAGAPVAAVPPKAGPPRGRNGPAPRSGPRPAVVVKAAPPVPAAATEHGTLIVGATPWAQVTIDGAGAGKTDLVTARAPGRYRVVVEVSGGAGRFQATAQVDAGKRTKCRYAGGGFTCGPPR